MTHHPDHLSISAQHAFVEGNNLFAAGKISAAKASYRKTLRLQPTFAEAHHNLAIIVRQQGDLATARDHLAKALSLEPQNALFNSSMGMVLSQLGETEQSISHHNLAIKLEPKNPVFRNNLGVAYQSEEKHDEAITAFSEAIKLAPKYPEALNNRGHSFLQQELVGKAAANFQRAVSLNPNYAKALTNLGLARIQLHRPANARAALEKAVAIYPSPEAYIGLGEVYLRLEEPSLALRSFKRALKTEPNSAEIFCQIANVHTAINQSVQAREYYHRALAINPDFAAAHIGLANLGPTKNEQSTIRNAYERKLSGPMQKALLTMAMGICADKSGDPKKAMDYYIKGNAVHRETIEFSIPDFRRDTESLKKTLSRDYIKEHLGSGHNDPAPIFVLGMPRSGTSLAEQILASHPKVHGAGEVNYFNVVSQASQLTNANNEIVTQNIDATRSTDFELLGEEYMKFLRSHAPDAQHITDKLPGNFRNLGLIRLALPNARIIHCKRNPADTCVSIFNNFFGYTHRYAHNLTELGQYYKIYTNLMAHWEHVLPENSFYTIEYEELVTNPEAEIKALLDYCGLEFHPDCLNFHKSKRVVNTASFLQVRQPIYKSSINSAHRYGDAIQPLLDALAD